MMPTAAPIWESATARLTATVDFPTPPFPEETAMVWRTSGINSALRPGPGGGAGAATAGLDRKSTRLNSSHITISYAVFCLKKKNRKLYSVHAGDNALRYRFGVCRQALY